MKSKTVIAAALLALTLTALPLHADGFANPALKPSNPPLQDARVDGLDIDQGTISVTDCAQLRATPEALPVCEGSSFYLTVSDTALRTKLKGIHLGDHIRINFTPANNTVTGIAGLAAPQISTRYRLLVLFLCALVPLLFATALTRGRPFKLIVGMDNHYSNSKLQAAAWFWVMTATYLEFYYFRVAVGGLDFLGGISIPQNLLLLSGASALTFVGAKAITQSKVNAAAAAAPAPNAALVVDPNAAPNIPAPVIKPIQAPGLEDFWKDIVQNDIGTFDFGDFQMVLVTLLAIGTYLLAVHHALGAVQLASTTTLPDLDTTILSAFGLGQGAYLAKKAVSNVS